MRKAKTIKDIAKAAGVSIATVSAVVNQSKYVSSSLEKRVRQAIQELGYYPNQIARSLKSKRSKLLGVTLTEVTNPFYPQLLEGVEHKAIEFGYALILLTTMDDEQKEYKLVESMIGNVVDGLILSTIDNENSKILRMLEDENIKYVLINRAPLGFKGSMVCPDSFKVGLLATNYLIQLGHRDIAFIGGQRQNGYLRESGFRKAMDDNKLTVREEWILDGGYTIEGAQKKIFEMIHQGNVPSAVFAANDLMAFGAAKAFMEKGYRIPQDVSIIGSDNIPFTEDFRIPLTTVDVGKFEMGRLGCELLLYLLGNENVKHKQIMLDPTLIIRESTACVRKQSHR